MLSLGPYDVALAVVVTAQSAAVAFLYAPRWKVLVFSLPFPFTFATLALGQRVDATSVLGLLMITAFVHGVRLLYARVRVPIVISIAISAILYCIVSWKLADVVPRDDRTFYAALVSVLLVALALLWLQPHREEPGHRTSLPIWAKLPIILGVVLFLIVVKEELRGFMAMFPMVSILATYETRKSLWTLCRQVPIMTLSMAALMTVARVTEPHAGLVASLLLGWIAFLAVLLPFFRSAWNNNDQAAR